MTFFTLGPDPYTDEDRANALPDDYDHPVVDPMFTGQGPGIRCGQLVIAPATSAYGIRPCLSVATKVNGTLRHFNYPIVNGAIIWTSPRKVGR